MHRLAILHVVRVSYHYIRHLTKHLHSLFHQFNPPQILIHLDHKVRFSPNYIRYQSIDIDPNGPMIIIHGLPGHYYLQVHFRYSKLKVNID